MSHLGHHSHLRGRMVGTENEPAGQFLTTSVGTSEPFSLDHNGREEVEITG
jgi:hypothetical protein